MKIEKPIKKSVKIALIFLAIGLLLGTLITFAATPSSTFYIGSGAYPGAPDYTIWREGSNYFAKNNNGQLSYSGTNCSDIFQSALDNDGDYIFFQQGTYVLEYSVTITHACRIEGSQRQWPGNDAYPSPPEVGVRFYYTGTPGSDVDGVLEISAINDVLIENIAIEGNVQTYPYVQMCGIQISRTADIVHMITIRNVEVSYFRVAIGTYKLTYGFSDSLFEDVKIENCATGVDVGGMCNTFRNVIMYRCGYGFSIAGVTHGTEITHSWLNDITYVSIRIWGNGTFLKVKDSWFENGNGTIARNEYNATLNPSGEIEVREVIFERSHFHSYNTTQAFFDFSNIVNGSIQFYSCIYDEYGDGSHPSADMGNITIVPPKVGANLVVENCYLYNSTKGIEYYPYGTDKGTTFPSSPSTGQQYYRTDLYTFYIYNGTDWDTVSGAQGPAGPSGTLEGEQPYSYLIFKNATATYMLNGETGDIDYYNTASSIVINYAIGNLTSGRTWRETVLVKGDYTLEKYGASDYCINVPTYTILDLYQARLTLDDDQNCSIIQITGAEGSSPIEHSEVWGGYLDGNSASQTSGDGITIWMGSASVIKDTVIYDCEDDGLCYTGDDWEGWFGLHKAFNVKIYNCGRGIYSNYHNDNEFSHCVVQNSDSHNVMLYGIHRLFYVHSIYAGGYSFYLPEGCDGTRLIECDADTPDAGQHNIVIGGDRNAIIGGYVHGQGSGYDCIRFLATAGDNEVNGVHCSGGNYAVDEISGADYNLIVCNIGRNITQADAFLLTGVNSIEANNLIT